MQLVHLFHQMHPDLPSSQYVASNQLSGFEELWVSPVSAKTVGEKLKKNRGKLNLWCVKGPKLMSIWLLRSQI